MTCLRSPASLALSALCGLLLLGCRAPAHPPAAGPSGTPSADAPADGVTDVAPPAPASTWPPNADRASVLAALRGRQFVALDHLLTGLVDVAAKDPQQELATDNAFAAFSIGDPALETLLDTWLAQAPDSAVALTARAVYFDRRGWLARGGAYTAETARAGLAEMARWHERANRDAEAALAVRSDLASAWGVLVDTTMGDQRRLEAVSTRALAAVPASGAVRSRVLGMLLPRWGGSYAQMTRFLAATRPFASRNPNLRRLENRIPLDRADVARRDGQLDVVERWLADALAAGGSDWHLYEARSYLRAKQQRNGDALADIEQALASWPDEPRLVSLQVRGLLALGRDREATTAIARLAALDPTADELAAWRRRLGREDSEACEALVRNGTFSAGLARCEAVLALAPADEPALYWKGRALLQLGRLAEAEQALSAALAASPRSRRAIENLDWLLAKRGAWDQIVALWSAYLALEPGDAKAWLERAGTHHHRGDAAAACRDLARSCELGGQEACGRAAQTCGH